MPSEISQPPKAKTGGSRSREGPRAAVEWRRIPGPEDGAGESLRGCGVSVGGCAPCHRTAHLNMAEAVHAHCMSPLPRLKESRGGFDPRGRPGLALWTWLPGPAAVGKCAAPSLLRKVHPPEEAAPGLPPLLARTPVPIRTALAEAPCVPGLGPRHRTAHLPGALPLACTIFGAGRVPGPLFSLHCPRGGGGGARTPRGQAGEPGWRDRAPHALRGRMETTSRPGGPRLDRPALPPSWTAAADGVHGRAWPRPQRLWYGHRKVDFVQLSRVLNQLRDEQKQAPGQARPTGCASPNPVLPGDDQFCYGGEVTAFAGRGRPCLTSVGSGAGRSPEGHRAGHRERGQAPCLGFPAWQRGGGLRVRPDLQGGGRDGARCAWGPGTSASPPPPPVPASLTRSHL